MVMEGFVCGGVVTELPGLCNHGTLDAAHEIRYVSLRTGHEKVTTFGEASREGTASNACGRTGPAIPAAAGTGRGSGVRCRLSLEAAPHVSELFDHLRRADLT